MKKRMCKDFDTVVLNGSDDDVKSIAEAIDIVTKERYGSATSRTLGSEESNVKVISTQTTAKTYKKIQGMIERAFPNMCIFYAKL